MSCESLADALRLAGDLNALRLENTLEVLGLADGIGRLNREAASRLPYRCNLIDIFEERVGRFKEPVTSLVIKMFLSYRENVRHPLLESFIDTFIGAPALSAADVVRPEVRAEKEHIDISVLDRNYALVFENKLKGADFEINQLARYVAVMRDRHHYDESRIFVIVMPQWNFDIQSIRKSVWRLPPDWELRPCAVNKRLCICDLHGAVLTPDEAERCRLCDKKMLSRMAPRVITLHDDFAGWLVEQAATLPDNQYVLHSAMLQFADYIKGLYSTRTDNKLKMNQQQFLQQQLLDEPLTPRERWQILRDKVNDVESLHTALNNLQSEMARKAVEEWYEQLKPSYPMLRTRLQDGLRSFGILVNGVWIGCWGGDNEGFDYQPYWGFYCEKDPDRSQNLMINRILEACDIDRDDCQDPDYNFIVWNNTLDGANRCDRFYKAAIRLGYLELED